MTADPGQGSSWVGPGPLPAPPAPHPQATTVLVLGICSLLVCGVLGPIAWVAGTKALRQIDAAPGAWSGREQVNVGRILGIVATILLGLMLLFVAGMMLFAVVMAAAGA